MASVGAVIRKPESGGNGGLAEGAMGAEATAERFRAASPASGRVALGAAGLTVVMFGVCGVLLLLTRDYQRAAFGAGGTVAALVCLAVGFVVARRQPASPIGWLLLGLALATAVG